MNELVNSFIVARLYVVMDAPTEPGENFDYRRHIYVQIWTHRNLSTGPSPVVACILRRCAGVCKYVRGTVLARLEFGEFSQFDVEAFKQVSRSLPNTVSI